MEKEKISCNETITLPHIKKEKLLSIQGNTWDLFYMLLSSYYDILDNKIADDDFTDTQRTLMTYNILYGEITTGGFLELIKNGYSSYIFDPIFSETLKTWGAIEMSILINKAKEIYFQNKVKLEVIHTTQEIYEMYHQYPEFNILDNRFFKIMDSESNKIHRYIQNHIDKFAVLGE